MYALLLCLVSEAYMQHSSRSDRHQNTCQGSQLPCIVLFIGSLEDHGGWVATFSAYTEYAKQCRWRRACMTRMPCWPPCSRQPRLRKSSKPRIGTASLLAMHCVDSLRGKSLPCPGQLSFPDSAEVDKPLCLPSCLSTTVSTLVLYGTFSSAEFEILWIAKQSMHSRQSIN